ncbi:type I-E CRISPR-associated endoribonuclease Cas2e [Levilactobacillus tangyuanensis]|uniref:Type I-E CRISPR-associated endoribonuclease Cas2e n=1 Tax=Levilactobacillus tangyuanensis TaxID=2486021 RepID=A0ABW1TJZ4_9LACO|nr:type I-E CRISPR-associated endoribonuclease Cas2e [Levilactobacillus tangyuanensis]
MIVITLTKVPKSLQGDLTKWYQEIQTGVYIGNVSARIRDLLWDRIMKNIGHGEATMVYNSNNELGYLFRTTRKDRAVIDFDGLPLMMHLHEATGGVKHGFSDAAKFHRAKLMSHKAGARQANVTSKAFVVVDLETTGLDAAEDEILSIGAVKRVIDGHVEKFYKLVKIEHAVPENIRILTNITSEIVQEQGEPLRLGLQSLKEFIGDLPLVGYNFHFDEMFLTNGFRQTQINTLRNRGVDLMPIVKKANKFLDNYRLKTVLAEYDIDNQKPHNSLSDAMATFELAIKLNENGSFEI